MIRENIEAISCYAACLQLKDSERIKEKFIKPRVEQFFNAMSINNYKEIPLNSEISDKDFDEQGIDYFYENIFYDIKKTKEGKIEFSVKYCITLDKTNCNCKKQCDKRVILYDEIFLNKQPVFYFIYISIEEIFSFLRSETSPH